MSKLYHYTSEAGMNGIFYGEKLWVSLTSKPGVNDPFDTVYIKQMIDKLIKKTNDYSQKLILRIMHDILNPPFLEEETHDYLKKSIFIFCVNEVENDQIMVKKFGSKKIVFDKDHLIKHFELLNGQNVYFKEFKHNKVTYIEAEQEAMIMDLVKEAVECFLNGSIVDYSYLSATPPNVHSGNEIDIDILFKKEGFLKKSSQHDKEYLESFWTPLANRFYVLAPFIKNPSFEEEKEYRFAFYRKSNESGYVPLIDYNTRLELPLNKNCLIECIELG